MKNITIKNDPDNRGRNELDEQMRSIWLTLADELRTISFDYDEYKIRDIRMILEKHQYTLK